MLNSCLRSINKWRPLGVSQSLWVQRCYASFAVKDILYETCDEAGSLITKFAKHVALERINICEQVPTVVHYSDYFPITELKYFERQLRNTSADQIAAVVVYASTYRSNADPSKFASILNIIDKFASDNVASMSVDTILRTLYSFLFLIPNWMTRLDFYGKAMQSIFKTLNQEGCDSKELFVQVCFYGGIAKKKLRNGMDNYWKAFLNKHIEKFLPQLSTLDMALVSNAAFKTSVVIESDSFNQRLLKEVLAVSADDVGSDGLYINFIKSMRLQRFKSQEVCERLSDICEDVHRLKRLQPRGLVHLFAFLAENLWDKDECTAALINQFVKNIKSSGRVSFGERVRGKDVATFLWCCAQLNCSLPEDMLRSIERLLLDKVENKEFNYFPDQLVDACLNLWVLNYKSEKLLNAAVQLKKYSSNKREQPKVESRLTVLLSAARIEQPSWCSKDTNGFEAFNSKARVPAYLLNSPDVPYSDVVSKLNDVGNVVSATISSPINGINIPGILVKLSHPDEPQMFIEFMTPQQTLQFSQQPVTMLRLKLRLLQSLGYSVKVIRTKELCESFDWNELFLNENTNEELDQNSVKA